MTDFLNKLLSPLRENAKKARAEGTFDILCISGAGALSVFAARVLAHMEDAAGEPLARRFHLIAGSSCGALLALGLAREFPASDLVRLLRQRVPEVFDGRPSIGRADIAKAKRELWRAQCDGQAWRSTLTAALGEKTRLSQMMHPVMVSAYDVSLGRPRLIGAPFASGGYGRQDLLAVDVAMAATAAPALFPVAELDGQKMVDGAVFAPSPDLVVLREAIHRLDAPMHRIRMISIGSLTGRFRLPAQSRKDMGLLSWSADGKLPALVMASQQQFAVEMMRDLLGDHYLRIDSLAPDSEGLPHPLQADDRVVERSLQAADSSWRHFANHRLLDSLRKR